MKYLPWIPAISILPGFVNCTYKLVKISPPISNDIKPKAPIHMLVCPKVHVASLNELEDKNLMAELLQTVKDVTKKIGLKSYKTLINTGKDAGQEVFHLHIHKYRCNLTGNNTE